MMTPSKKEQNKRERRLGTLAKKIEKMNAKDGPMVLIYINAKGAVKVAGSPGLKDLVKTEGLIRKIIQKEDLLINDKETEEQTKFQPRPLDATLFEEGTEDEIENWGWEDLRKALARCICPLQENGQVTKVKHFWDAATAPAWWPTDVPFESPGKRVDGRSVLQKDHMRKVIRRYIEMARQGGQDTNI